MSQQIFESVKYQKPGRSTFDLSHDVKMSMKFGGLYPIMCEDVAPGDNFKIGCQSLIRFAPLIAPVMHKINATMHYFFVPKRLLWDNYMKWYKNEKDPLTDLPYVHPYIGIDHQGSNWSELMDYMGLPDPLMNPTATPGTTNVSALPFSAYTLIYNEYYRDQNLQVEQDYKLVDGNNSSNAEILTMRYRAWMHDYFTSALPFAQKGDPVKIPLDGTVVLDDVPLQTGRWIEPSTGNPAQSGEIQSSDGIASPVPGQVLSWNTINHQEVTYDPQGSLIVRNGEATLNDLRIAMRVQEWLEKSARGGTRDNEFIRVQFGVRTSDARLQRPEYITGIKTPVTISEVLNTTGTVDAPQGQMAGHGVSVVNGNYGSYYAEEPGYIIGIMNIQPETAYFQGIPKHWLKITDPTENLFPVFGNLGEQAIERRELYAYTASGAATFGYIPRYSEYKYANNRVAGDFKSTLAFWHMARIFATEPALNEQFISAHTATTRIFAVESGDDYLWTHVFNRVQASRLLPFYGTPTF